MLVIGPCDRRHFRVSLAGLCDI